MTPSATMRELESGVWIGQGTHVNFVVLVDGTDVTLIDAGWSGDSATVVAALASLGRQPEDVRAIVITHAHIDHVGGVAKLHAQYGTDVFAHPAELAHAHGDVHEQARPLDIAPLLWRPRAVRWVADVARVGALGHVELPFAQPYDPSGPLDLPGRPRPVLCPGHTSGHTAYALDSGIVATGDALVTGHPLANSSGPQLLPRFFSAHPEQTARTLDAIAEIEADQIAPGHGEPWRGDLAAAVTTARQR